MEEIFKALDRLFDEGRSAVLATIIQQAGPSPRGIGTKCLIMDDGSIVGTIGGGILEARTLDKARQVFDTGLPVRLYFSLKGKDVAETEMLCGGQVEVFLEPVPARHPPCVTLFRTVGESLRKGTSGLLITLIDPKRWEGGDLPKLFLGKNKGTVGSLPGAQAITEALLQDRKKIMRSQCLSVSAMKDDSGRDVEVLVEPIVAKLRLYVFGAGHVSRQIVPLAARVGFHVVVVDDREEFADPGIFPEAGDVRHIPFEGAAERLAVDGASFVVIVTRGHMHDKMVLAQALSTKARYIGMIGSRRKRDIIYENLLAEGYSQADLDRVHSPIGMDIGAETPEEIAVSIVAQLIQVRAGLKLNSE
ncbi:MAG: XdhC family protein [Deltaproteobacteria bacterium]|nr:XdhC family protein [Deltaproteobacteria bacterium]